MSISHTPEQSGGTNSVEISYEQSSMQVGRFNWRFILLLCTWFLGLVLLALLVVQTVKSKRNKTFVEADATNEVLGDVEQQENDNEDAKEDTRPDERGFNSSPVSNKNAVVTPFLAALSAFILSISAQAGCEFADLSGNPLLSRIGIWFSEYDYSFGGESACYSNLSGSKDYENFPSNLDRIKIDEALMTTMMGAVLASVLGGVALVALVCFWASPSFPLTTVRHTAFLLWLAAFSQALTLSVFSTNECHESSECLLSFGGFLSSTAIYFWVLSAFGASFVPLI